MLPPFAWVALEAGESMRAFREASDEAPTMSPIPGPTEARQECAGASSRPRTARPQPPAGEAAAKQELSHQPRGQPLGPCLVPAHRTAATAPGRSETSSKDTSASPTKPSESGSGRDLVSSPAALDRLRDGYSQAPSPFIPRLAQDCAALPAPDAPRPAPPLRPRLRLSQRHGAAATAASVAEYVQSLGRALKERLSGHCTGWVPRTAELSSCYRIVRGIGHGHSGEVSLCEDVETKQRFACKTIRKASMKRPADVDELCSEVLAMLKLQSLEDGGPHPGILQLHEVMEDGDAVHLVTEYCPGGDLFDYVVRSSKLSEQETAVILKQLIGAVLYMHSKGVIHRDLKPENILLLGEKQGSNVAPSVKVADFGLCVQVSQVSQGVFGVAGSPFYMAPEIVCNAAYGYPVDVWSLGVLLYTCLCGYLPFWASTKQGVFQKVLTSRPNLSKKPWPQVSPAAKDLVCKMLEPNPVLRISLLDILMHPFMLENCPELKQWAEHLQKPAMNKESQLSLISNARPRALACQ